MRHLHPIVASVPVLLITITAATGQEVRTEPPPEPEARAQPEQDRLVRGNTAFALDLYRELIAEDGGNVFIAPHSVSTALAMTYAGARGETAEQIAAALHFDLEANELHPALAALAGDLREAGGGDAAVDLAIANRVWAQQGETIRDAFAEIMRTSYDSGFEPLDFQQDAEAARRTINAWIDEHTRGRVVDLLQPRDLTPATMFVLTNAVAFDGTWRTRFDEDATREGMFFVTPTESVAVPLMSMTATMAHAETAEVHVVELPYDGERLSMVLLVPRRRDGLAAVESSLTAATLDGWLDRLAEHPAHLVLPRFELQDRRYLERPLSRLGMPIAFSAGSADFSGICCEPGALWIDLVVHQARIEVDEAGTEAAAATAVTIKRGGPVVRADRPFMFLIRDRVTGTILFLGRVVDPVETAAGA
jgi:serpin B